MSNVGNYVVAALGLAVLMVVHEGGHYLAARKFGMRVVKFSIGFGPTLWKHRPKNSPTIYQIGIIPFLAYVQIAGMNPYEDNDPKDPGSYMNASLWGRTVTIAAGPLMNYLFASVLIFAGLMIGGRQDLDLATATRVKVDPAGAAAAAGVLDGDRIMAVNGTTIEDFVDLAGIVNKHAGEEIDLTIDRAGEELHIAVTPEASGDRKGKISVKSDPMMRTLSIGEVAKKSVIDPPIVVYNTVKGLVRIITLKDKPELGGPVRIVEETAEVAKQGPGWLLRFLGALSAYLGAFNLLPFPALDGGRLMFLGFEAASRRKPDAKIEARVHAFGLLILLGLIAVVTFFDLKK